MTLDTVRRIAADLLRCGTSRVRFANADEARKAITRDDVRGLISQGIVYELPIKGVSRGKARFKQSRVQSGRRRGAGSRKGAPTLSDKERWIQKVRAQRHLLKSFKSRLQPVSYREAYRMVKGNSFRSKKQLLSFIEENLKKQ